MMRLPTLVLALVIAAPSLAAAQSAVPDPAITPGAINPAVTQENIHATICVRGWTRTVRPAEAYTERLKREQVRQLADRRLRHYEEDHLIPLELGGSPDDPRNLWPEPRGGWLWTAEHKDQLEDALHRRVCSGQMSLADAQHAIATDWRLAFLRYVGIMR